MGWVLIYAPSQQKIESNNVNPSHPALKVRFTDTWHDVIYLISKKKLAKIDNFSPPTLTKIIIPIDIIVERIIGPADFF